MLHARVLGYLDEVARAGSVRRAAERLNVSPTAVNKRILLLEAQYGIELFERLPRGMRLTAAGELLVAHVRRTLGEQRQMHRQIERLRGATAGEIRLATMNGPASGLLPRVVLRLQQRAPHVRVAVTTAFIGDLVKLLHDREVDLCLAYNLPADPRLTVIETVDAALGVVVGAGHPLARAASLRVSDCLGYPIALADEFMVMGRTMRDLFARAGAPLQPMHRSNSVEYMKALARHGETVAFLSRYDVDDEVAAGTLAWRPLAGQATANHLQLVRHAQAGPHVASDLLAREIIDTLHQLRGAAA